MAELVGGDAEVEVRLGVNGESVTLRCPARELLSDTLRHRLGLTGTHVGCEHGICGACTVLVDDAPARACLLLTSRMHRRRVETIEGLAGVDGYGVTQAAFARHGALQCGFCTPGFVMVAEGLRRQAEAAGPLTDEEILDGASANLCRCTGYSGIIAAMGELLAADAPGTGGSDEEV